MTKETKEKSVWETLSVIDVSEHVEDKNGFTYLSWSWAWTVLKNTYPDAWYKKHTFQNQYVIDGVAITLEQPYMYDPITGSSYVQVTVAAGGQEADEIFPVLNYSNKAVMNAKADDINTAMQRCWTKAMAMLGLGCYIYAGEDLPPSKGASGTVEKTIEVVDGEKKQSASGAEMIFTAMTTFIKDQKTTEDLEKFYRINQRAAEILSQLDPGLYAKMISQFKAAKAKLDA